VDAEGGGESGHPDEGVEVDADGEPGVICPEALLDHQFLGVAGPSLDERLREQAAPHVSLDELAEHPAVGEVAGRDLVHRDGPRRPRAALRPPGDRSMTTPSYSWTPASSRMTGTLTSHPALRRRPGMQAESGG